MSLEFEEDLAEALTSRVLKKQKPGPKPQR